MTPAQKTRRIVDLGKALRGVDQTIARARSQDVYQISYRNRKTGEITTPPPLCGVGTGCEMCSTISDALCATTEDMALLYKDQLQRELAGLMDGETDKVNEGKVGDS